MSECEAVFLQLKLALDCIVSLAAVQFYDDKGIMKPRELMKPPALHWRFIQDRILPSFFMGQLVFMSPVK